MPAGLFDPLLVDAAWFDPALVSDGRFDETLVDAAGSSVSSGAFSAAGVATASLIGAALDIGVWNPAGVASTSLIGAALDAGVWNPAGLATSSFVGAALDAGVWSPAGVAASSIVGAALDAGAWSPAGVATSSLTVAALDAATFAMTGTATSSIAGAALDAGVITWAGVATSAIGDGTLAAGVLNATGTSSSSLVGGTVAGDTGALACAGDSVMTFAGASTSVSTQQPTGGPGRGYAVKSKTRQPRAPLVESTLIAETQLEIVGDSSTAFGGASAVQALTESASDSTATFTGRALSYDAGNYHHHGDSTAGFGAAALVTGGFSLMGITTSVTTGETLYDAAEIEKRIAERITKLDFIPAVRMPTPVQQSAHVVKTYRSHGIAKRRRRVPKARYPKSIELEYGKAIIALVARTRPMFDQLMRELPALLERGRARRMDDVENEAQRARRLIAEATERMRQAIQPTALEVLATKFANRTEQFQKGQFEKQVRAALGVDVAANDRKLPALMDHFVAQNVALIRSIPERTTTDLDKMVTNAFSSGTRAETLQKEIAARFGSDERHARLIARDQIGKLSSAVTEARHRSIGITKFEWQTMGDERVRDEHEILNGQVFSYDNPPDEGLPGEPVCCRCSQQPIFDDILEQIDDDD